MTRHRLTLFAAALACPIVYLVFVTHFWVNEPNADDWNKLWLVSQSISGHLTLGMLWAQHYEDRIFVPNLVFVAAGRASRGNEETVIALSAAVFIATYFAFLGLCRTYLGRLSWQNSVSRRRGLVRFRRLRQCPHGVSVRVRVAANATMPTVKTMRP